MNRLRLEGSDLMEAGGAEKELAGSEVTKEGNGVVCLLGWSLRSLPSSPFSAHSLCPILN